MIPHTVLIAVEPFGPGGKQAAKPGSPAGGRPRQSLSPERAGAAIGRGLQAANPSLHVDVCPITPTAAPDPPATPPDPPARPADPPARPADLPPSFDGRMRAARAVVLAVERLDERTLLGSYTFEIATRARQAGVPAYAVTAHNELSPFDARILDLQVILQAGDVRTLRRAGEKLGRLV